MPGKPVSRIITEDQHQIRIPDPSFLQNHRHWREQEAWSGAFNIAAWLRFPDGLCDMVQLMLGYRDRERRKTYPIDRCLPNRQTLILLNGVVQLEISGQVTDMSLFLTGLPENAVWILDQYHIEPRQTALMKHNPMRRQGGRQ